MNASCEQAHQVASVTKEANSEESTLEAISGAVIQKCFFCGNKKNSRKFCPARDVECYRCGKKGHFAKVCRSFVTRQTSSSSAALMPISCGNETNSKVNVPILINGVSANALIDAGSTLSHTSEDFCKRLRVTFKRTSQRVGLAVTNCVSSCL